MVKDNRYLPLLQLIYPLEASPPFKPPLNKFIIIFQRLPCFCENAQPQAAVSGLECGAEY